MSVVQRSGLLPAQHKWRISRRAALVSALAAAATAGSAARSRAQTVRPYAVEDLFSFIGDRGVVLSPDGTQIAILSQAGTARAPSTIIDVLAASNPDGPRRRIALGALVAEAVQWGNDRRLLVRVALTQRSARRAPIGSNIRAEAREVTSRRILSVDAADGSVAVLFQDQRQRMRNSLDLGNIVDVLPRDSSHVLMTAWERDGTLGLHRVNIIDGSAVRLERGVGATVGWETQAGVAVLRYDINRRGDLMTLYGRMPGEEEWRFIRRTRVIDAPDFSWIGETDRPGVVLVSARAEGEDVEAVREMDLRDFSMGPPMASRSGRDVLSGLKDSGGNYIGAAFYGDRLEYSFSEPGLSGHHQALDKFFEGDCDVALTHVDAARNRFIARVSGPREPGAWFFYDRTMRSIKPIAARMLLDPERLGRCELVRVPTRDGGQLEAYLTAPPGSRPGPLVALVHGGPEVRDYRGWNRQVQALAAQGWWVVQPNFRGSGGYGQAFATEGWRRWGDRMQHDVEDAVAHVIQLRGLDRERVAIMGTSYGGYAALMGAVLRPDLYRAAISICGVGDLTDILNSERRDDDAPDKPVFAYWTRRIGVLGVDDAMLEKGSPRRRAAEIACPVLLVHGANDAVVPASQSRRMQDALQIAGKTVSYVEIPDAGHADWDDAQEQALLERYVAMLLRVFA